ncbi:polysaccharide biosynthesis tyrosine autokinase [candidate division KSB1 bacterium]|nr:polysaccharide biosynthesis tyrosine autokinase [candidate division KSB1 bacterium]
MDVIQEQQITLNDYWAIVKRRKWIILLSFLVVFLSTLYFTLTSPPIFEATAMIMLKEDGGMQQQIFDMPSLLRRDTMISNHVEILQSRTLARDVIQRLQNSPYADSLYILGRTTQQNDHSLFRFFKNLFTGSTRSGQKTVDETIDGFLESAIDVIPKRDTDILELKIEALSPFEAMFVANTWMEAYQDMDAAASRGEIGEVRDFLEQKLTDVQESLSTSEDALKQYKETHGVAELNTETQQMIEQAAAFESEYQAARTELESNSRRLAHLKDQLDVSQRAIFEEGASLSSPVIAELQKQLAQSIGEMVAYEQQLKGAGYATQNDSKLNNMRQRNNGLQKRISEETRKMAMSSASSRNPLDFSETLLNSILEIESENISIAAKIEALDLIIGRYNVSLNALPEKSLRLARLQREAEVNNNIFLMLREKYEESRIAEAGQVGAVRIVDYAEESQKPTRPKKRTNILLGLLVGLGLGVGLAFVREYLDTSIKSTEDVDRLGMPVLASIPKIAPQKPVKTSKRSGEKIGHIEARLITHLPSNSPISESYRSLRTNVQYADLDHTIKTILFTSPGPGDGKSTSVANLAVTFSQMGAKTLLVDADLRRPVLHGLFGAPRNIGLTNVLVGRSSLDEAIKKTHVKNLHLLAAGILPRNPSEFLASKVMRRLINRLGEEYDIVLIDSPPIITVTDAAILSTRVDGTVMVARAGVTDREALKQARTLLDKVKAKFYGVVVNCIIPGRKYGYYYDYYSNTA